MSQAGIIDISNNDPQIPTQFDTDSGTAIPLNNILEVLGGPGIETSGSGNTVTISLTGGGIAIDQINVDAATAPGTDPVVPSATGEITVTGGQVSSGTIGANVIRSNSLAANTYTMEVQQSGSAAAQNTTLNGVAHFNSGQFSVSNGFVSLSGGGLAIDSVVLQTGSTPIVPDGFGQITFNGSSVAAGTNPVRTNGTAANTMQLEVQISQALAAADATKIGLANFDSSAFDVSATGFVQLNGGGIAATAFDVQANTAPGTDPVVPTASGVVTVNGAVVANHSVVLESRSRAANAYNLEVQYATSAAATDGTKSGVAHFNSTQFSVDASGFVALAGGGQAIDSIGTQTGTNPIAPTAAGLVTINGAVVAAGTNPVRSDGTGANTMAIEVQISQAIASTDATKIGLSNFNSAHFSVDANGFVSSITGGFAWNDVSGAFSPLKQNGYFITGTATGTLPAAPAQGDTIQFFVDHASQVLTIQASGSQIIRMGSLVSSAGGTWVSTLQGDSCELVYRTSDTCWCAVDFVGTWTLT